MENNMKAVREVYEWAEKNLRDYGADWQLHNQFCEMFRAALAAPPRQCDVGTADEQGIRLRKFCVSQKWCGRCPLRKPSFTTHTDCKILWAQLPYEEGGAK